MEQLTNYLKCKIFVISCFKRRKDGKKIWTIPETPINKLECLAGLFLYDAYDYTIGSYGEFKVNGEWWIKN